MKTWSTNEIRKAFLDYFEQHEHEIVSSSSLIPNDDPTLFFTNAGMVQFKSVFLGKEKRKYTRAASSQRCLRASGKHNDLENVGYTNRHHTFFEMLGNFSFGDYFKKEAIHYAWQFLTTELGIDPRKLWVTVHHQDQEAEKLWHEEFKKSGLHAQGLSQCDDKDNFWAMGETGPCGYCSEIFYDHGDQLLGDPPGGKHEGERYVEIWNLVFMQFERDDQGALTPLPKPSIDTGMGLERIAAVMQGVQDNYATDVFTKLQKIFITILNTKFNIDTKILLPEDVRIASRVVTDHIRSSTFLIADGVIPSNEKAGYVLRSIIRRAVYYLYRLGVRRPCFFQLVRPLITIQGDIYPEGQLTKMQAQIEALIEQEEIRFLDTLDRGLKILDSEIAKLKGKTISGKMAFNLHDTYGLPIILTAEIARKRGLNLDQIGFEKEMEKQRETSRAASKFEVADNLKLDLDISSTKFLGYTQNSIQTKIYSLFKKDGSPTTVLKSGEDGIVVLAQTPFYAESGGQTGDSGEISANHGTFLVQDTKKYGDVHLHLGYVINGSIAVPDEINAAIDVNRRQMTKLNHSATHLLHQALRLVLGEHAMQRGSFVDNKRLRFDFTHTLALTIEEIREIEQIVNSQIRAILGVNTEVKSLEDAKRDGACAIFGEKYSENVRVITMGSFSKELCGGTHVINTGEIGLFKIVSETGIAAGIRRIEAVTGENALIWVDQLETEIKSSAQILGIGNEQIIDKIKQLAEEKRLQEKEILRLQTALINSKSKELTSLAVNVDDVLVLSTELPNTDIKILRQAVDALKQQLNKSVIVLATITSDNKVQLVVGITSNLTSKIKANELLQYVIKQIDGTGGGKADLAQGGGNNAKLLTKALESVVPWVKNNINP